MALLTGQLNLCKDKMLLWVMLLMNWLTVKAIENLRWFCPKIPEILLILKWVWVWLIRAVFLQLRF